MKSGPSDKYSIRAVDRALNVLKVVSEAPAPLNLTEIASQIELSVPTVFRLVRTLENAGLLMADAVDASGRYTLGFQIFELASALERQLAIPAIAQPFLVEARSSTGETASIALRSGDMYFHASQAQSRQSLREIPEPGVPLPLYQGAAGRVLLAECPEGELADYLSRTEIVAMNPTTPSSPDALVALLATVRERGYDEGATQDGGARIAVPVHGHDGRVRAVVQIAGPRDRFQESGSTWVDAARAAAKGVSVALGYRGRQP